MPRFTVADWRIIEMLRSEHPEPITNITHLIFTTVEMNTWTLGMTSRDDDVSDYWFRVSDAFAETRQMYDRMAED